MPKLNKKLNNLKVKDNTLSRDVKTDPQDRVSIEVGDSKNKDNFLPQLKIMRWDNETNFSVRAEEDSNATVVNDGNKVKYVSADKEVHFYEKPETTDASITKSEQFDDINIIDRGTIEPLKLAAEYELSFKGVDRAIVTTSFINTPALLMYGQQEAESYFETKKLSEPIYRLRTANHSNPMYADENLGWLMMHVPNARGLDSKKIHNDLFDAIQDELTKYGIVDFVRDKYKLYIVNNGIKNKIASVGLENNTLITYVNFGTDYNKSQSLYKKQVEWDSLDSDGVIAKGIWNENSSVPKSVLSKIANNFVIGMQKNPVISVFNEDENSKLAELETLNADTTWRYKNERDDILAEDVGEQFEIETKILKRPPTDEIKFSLQMKNIRLEYQPALTPEEKFAGTHRPANVVGSYSAYHLNKKSFQNGKQYASGKAFHIYRPKVVDANGDYSWGQLSIDQENNELTVNIDPDWLDNAAYPILVDPTFGYSTIGGSTQTVSTNNLHVGKFTLSENGDVSKLTVYSRGTSTYGGTVKTWKGTIYTDDAGYPDAYEAPLGSEVDDTTTAQWRDSTFATDISLTSGVYWIGMHKDSGANHVWYYDSGSTNQGYYTGNGSITYNTPPDPFPAGANGLDHEYSVYATYTATGGGGTDVNSERDAEVTGQQTSNAARDAETTGQDAANTNRDAEITGSSAFVDVNDERSAEITGNIAPVLTATQNGANIDLSWTYSNP